MKTDHLNTQWAIAAKQLMSIKTPCGKHGFSDGFETFLTLEFP